MTCPLELLHMDLLEPQSYISFSGNHYGLLIVDEFFGSLGLIFLKMKTRPNNASKDSHEELKMTIR